MTVAEVSKVNPLGALRMMVPVPMSPTESDPSVSVGPVRVVKAPVPLVALVSAEIEPPRRGCNADGGRAHPGQQ